jgi:hypothetical protein
VHRGGELLLDAGGLATFQRKIERLSLFDPAAAAAGLCMIGPIPPKTFLIFPVIFLLTVTTDKHILILSYA